MPEIIPINSTVHFKAAFNVQGVGDVRLMTRLRQLIRSWCINKVSSNDPILHKSWFYIGNNPKVEPVQYNINNYRIRTASAPSDDPQEPDCWTFQMIHPDWEETARRWSVEIMLRKEVDGKVRFTTIIRHWMIANYIGEYPAPPAPSAPSYLRSIIDDASVVCSVGDGKLESKPIDVTNATAQSIYDKLVWDEHRVPFVFMAYHPASDGVLLSPRKVASTLIGNANVYVLCSEAVVEEMNYYLGDQYSCAPGSIRVYMPRLDKTDPDDSRRHRYLSVSYINIHEDEAILRFLANGLSRNGSTFRMSDLKSFTDIFSVRRLHVIKRLSSESSEKSDEASMVWEENDKITSELAEWESAALQYESENEELKRQLGKLKYRVDQADRILQQNVDIESQAKAIFEISKLPQSLPEVLQIIARMFPMRIDVTDNALATARSYALEESGLWGKIDGLAIAWDMAFAMATSLYKYVFLDESNRLEDEFNESNARFELSMNEGRQTKKDAKLMAIRKIDHNGTEYDITPHIKYGNRKPKLLRLYFAIDRERRKIVVGHFGDHLDNFTTKKM